MKVYIVSKCMINPNTDDGLDMVPVRAFKSFKTAEAFQINQMIRDGLSEDYATKMAKNLIDECELVD